MGKKDKLIARLKGKPGDFTFDELESLLAYFGYVRDNKGRTSGSRVAFLSAEHAPVLLHRPHPGNELRAYQIKQLIDILTAEGLI